MGFCGITGVERLTGRAKIGVLLRFGPSPPSPPSSSPLHSSFFPSLCFPLSHYLCPPSLPRSFSSAFPCLLVLPPPIKLLTPNPPAACDTPQLCRRCCSHGGGSSRFRCLGGRRRRQPAPRLEHHHGADPRLLGPHGLPKVRPPVHPPLHPSLPLLSSPLFLPHFPSPLLFLSSDVFSS